MTSSSGDLLCESAWKRAQRDTWPSDWWRKLGKRALIAALALGANFFLQNVDARGELARSALVGLGAFVLADAVLYPLNFMLAPLRQRNELREWARSRTDEPLPRASLRAAVIRGRGGTKLVDVANPGDIAVKNIVARVSEADRIIPVDWSSGDVVIDELLPGDRASVPFLVPGGLGRATTRTRVELSGKAVVGESEEEVRTSVVIDPHRL